MGRARTLMKMSAGAVLRTVRSLLFMALLLASRVLVPVLRLMAAAGILVFVFCLLVRRDQSTAMWAGAGLAVSAVAVELALGAAIRALAPSDVVVISEV
jgi:hypothetical protein